MRAGIIAHGSVGKASFDGVETSKDFLERVGVVRSCRRPALLSVRDA
jgi:hypothetical protein